MRRREALPNYDKYFRSLYERFSRNETKLAKHAGISEAHFKANLPRSVQEFVDGMLCKRWGDLSAGSMGPVGSRFNSCAPDCFGFVLTHDLLMKYNQQHDVEHLKANVRELSANITDEGTTLDFVAWQVSETTIQVKNDATGECLRFGVHFAGTDDYDVAFAWMVRTKEVGMYGLVQVKDPEPTLQTPFHAMALVGTKGDTLRAQDISRDLKIKDVLRKDFHMALLISPEAHDGVPWPVADADYEQTVRELFAQAEGAYIVEVAAGARAAPEASEATWLERFVADFQLDPDGSLGVHSVIASQGFDGVEALCELDADDVREMFPKQLGPRKKLLKALEQKRAELQASTTLLSAASVAEPAGPIAWHRAFEAFFGAEITERMRQSGDIEREVHPMTNTISEHMEANGLQMGGSERVQLDAQMQQLFAPLLPEGTTSLAGPGDLLPMTRQAALRYLHSS